MELMDSKGPVTIIFSSRDKKKSVDGSGTSTPDQGKLRADEEKAAKAARGKTAEPSSLKHTGHEQNEQEFERPEDASANLHGAEVRGKGRDALRAS